MIYLLNIVILYFVLLWVIPKGNNLQEMLNLPVFLVRNFLVPKKNLVTRKIRFGKKRNQYFIFCQPKNNPVNKQQLILYYHGGGWTSGNPEMLLTTAQLLADHGYASIFANYRKAPFVSYYGMREDLSLCLKKIQEQKSELGLEDKKIVLGGMSAGATLAALMLFQKEELQKINFDKNIFSGIFLSGAPIDLSVMSWSIPLWLFAGNRKSNKFFHANPANHFSEEDKKIPMLLIHGTKDGLVNYKNIQSFVKKNELTDTPNLDIHTVENGTHMYAASWGYEDNDLRKVILEWLQKLEKQNGSKPNMSHPRF